MREEETPVHVGQPHAHARPHEVGQGLAPRRGGVVEEGEHEGTPVKRRERRRARADAEHVAGRLAEQAPRVLPGGHELAEHRQQQGREHEPDHVGGVEQAVGAPVAAHLVGAVGQERLEHQDVDAREGRRQEEDEPVGQRGAQHVAHRAGVPAQPALPGRELGAPRAQRAREGEGADLREEEALDGEARAQGGYGQHRPEPRDEDHFVGHAHEAVEAVPSLGAEVGAQQLQQARAEVVRPGQERELESAAPRPRRVGCRQNEQEVPPRQGEF